MVDLSSTLPFGPIGPDMTAPLRAALNFIGEQIDRRKCVVIGAPETLAALQDQDPKLWAMLPTCFKQTRYVELYKVVGAFDGVPVAEAIHDRTLPGFGVFIEDVRVGGLFEAEPGKWCGYVEALDLARAVFESETCANPNHQDMTEAESAARDTFGRVINHCRTIPEIAEPARIIGLFIAALADTLDLEPEELSRLLVWSSVAPDVEDDTMRSLMNASLHVRAKSKADGTW